MRARTVKGPLSSSTSGSGLFQISGDSKLYVRIKRRERSCSFRVSVRDVKSESYNMSEESVKFEEVLKEIIFRIEDVNLEWRARFRGGSSYRNIGLS